jgi:(S)-sulfolactate dehydrogenase
MADIVISEFMDEKIIGDAFKGLDVFYDPALVDNREALLAEVREARALIVRNRTQVDEELLAAAKKLQVVGRLGVGLDNIDLQACDGRGVKVCPASGANDLSVAEYVITATLSLLRGAWFSTERMIRGEWPRTEMIGLEASGKRMGLVGFGAIARETANRARVLGMNVAAYDPYLLADDPAWELAQSVDFQSLLKTSDVISLHIPLTDKTRHLIDAEALAQMKPGAILVNAARGGVVDEQALANALQRNHLAGAALDVFENEPLSEAGGSVFKGVPNLILTPHIAGVTKESNIRVSRVTAQNVLENLS